MKILANLFASVVVAIAIAAIAILSVQNAALVSLKFLVFQSIQMPVGVVLAFSAGVGLLGGAIAPLFLQKSDNRQTRSQDERFENEDDF